MGDAATSARSRQGRAKRKYDGGRRSSRHRPGSRELSCCCASTFGPPRAAGGPVTRREMNIAAALQKKFEDAVFSRCSYLKEKYGVERICLAGGVALNVVMTGKLARSGIFKDVYVFPASGDDGGRIGAAQYIHHHVLGKPIRTTYLRLINCSNQLTIYETNCHGHDPKWTIPSTIGRPRL